MFPIDGRIKGIRLKPNMHSVLFVTTNDIGDGYKFSGGAYGSRIHLETLKSMGLKVKALSISRNRQYMGYSDIEMIPATKSKIDTLIKNCRGYAGYLNPCAEKIILNHIKQGTYNIIFLDSSNLGRIAKKIKLLFPEIKIISFFHDVAYMYMLSKIRVEGLQYLPMLFASLYNEILTAKFSDLLVALSGRDKSIIESKYKAKVSYILPPWYDDYIISWKDKMRPLSNPLQILFFGSWFHVNVSGIRWFIENVLSKSDVNLIVAGNGMEKLKDYYNNNKKLLILGQVEDADNLYNNADCVVAPIFDGTGMKIKIGDTFRHGKTVVGTEEAFAGYNIVSGREGYICKTSDDFIKAFKDISSNQKRKYNAASYNYFKDHLSKKAAYKQMTKIIFGGI
jgi:hypothetical protein